MSEMAGTNGNYERDKEEEYDSGGQPEQAGLNDVEDLRQRIRNRYGDIAKAVGKGAAFGAGKEIGEKIVEEHGHGIVEWFIRLIGGG